MNHEDYCTFEQCVKLKELGFDWECDYLYYYTFNNHRTPQFASEITCNFDGIETYWYAPTLAQAQKWLREVKDIIINVNFDNWNKVYECHIYIGFAETEHLQKSYASTIVLKNKDEDWYTYEQALSAGIDRVIELLKEKNNDTRRFCNV